MISAEGAEDGSQGQALRALPLEMIFKQLRALKGRDEWSAKYPHAMRLISVAPAGLQFFSLEPTRGGALQRACPWLPSAAIYDGSLDCLLLFTIRP